ncbi:uncharacterized protein [Henckelia pumila]|uniref:uncharacterized protein n=1 Tax=Henckelia pumila TaxID=405737 RepID=UPI003C6E9B4A
MADYDESHDSGGDGHWDGGDAHRHRRGHREERRRVSMHRFMQVSPKPLAGGETPEAAEEWLERMKHCFREFCFTDAEKMESLGFLLEGRARKWWRSTSAPCVAARGAATWTEFRTAFQIFYFPPALSQARASEFLVLRQGTMTIEEYQQKLFDLLPYCPHIAESFVAMFDHFLQGLNPEIHQMVAVGSDMTYEGLVDRFHQIEDSLQRNRSMVPSFSSRPTSSSGPRGQSFKKQGGTSSSSSGSGGVQRFGSQRMSRCHQCKRRNPAGPCPISASACYQCGQEGHMKRDCHMFIGAASGSRGSQATGKLFALNQEQAEADSDRMIANALLVVSTPIGSEVLAKRLVVGCSLDFEGYQLSANLMILAMEDFDYIIGIDLMTTYRAIVDCYQRFVQFRPEDGEAWYFYDIQELPVVRDFPDVFPEEIQGLPLVREIEFGIELMPGTTPISRALYRLSPSEMRELQS